jgi:BirA family biotin operon repressor/biotin-[acetyl-CoA-carboxylase] ligase
MIVTEALSANRIRQALTAQTVGRHIYLFGEVSSTNSALVRLAKAGAQEGAVVLAEGQTAGRGRLGKIWFSPPGMNLYASVLFRPPITPSEVAVFSFIAPLALADAIQEEGVEPAIKWPNDILVAKKKVAGILAESVAQGNRVDFVILGVAVNLNVERETLMSALGPAGRSAISLREAVGLEIDRNAFSARFLALLDEWFEIYFSKGAKVILQAWRDRDITTGRRIEVREEPARFEGRAIGVNAEGALVVQDFGGQVRRVVTGEIRFLD